MIHIIYLLGGNSQRFQSNKLLTLYKNQYLYQYGYNVLKQLVASRSDCSLLVVTQYQDIHNQIESSLFHQDCQKGLSYTIQHGMNHIQYDTDDYFMFVVGDQPFMNIYTLHHMINEVLQQKPLVASLAYKQRLGNPTMFHCSLAPELLDLKGDEGGRKVYYKHLDSCINMQVEDEKELYDIDTIEDMQKAL